MAVKRFFLDGMIYNLLENEPDVCARIKALVDAGEIEIVASPVLVTELRRSPSLAADGGWCHPEPLRLKR